VSVAGPRPDGELFGAMVVADVVVVVAAAMPVMALVAAMVRLHDVSSLFRVPTLE
jgi:hypothetical protein